MLLNFRWLSGRLGPLAVRGMGKDVALVFAASALAAVTGAGLASLTAGAPAWITACVGLCGFGLVYLTCTAALGHPDAKALVRRFARSD